MTKQEATNTFLDGLLMDMNPLTTPNTVMTKCLNGTLVTYNGNEHVLLNDMGNAKIEGAYLPEGYVPLGTTLLGGIIYIVSYNPIINKCLIGSFPSPLRDFNTKDSDLKINSLTWNTFFGENPITIGSTLYEEVKNLTTTLKINDEDFELSPGDLFKVVGNVLEYLTAILKSDLSSKSIYRNPKIVRLTLQSVDNSGKAKDITDLQWYPFDDSNSYFIENYIEDKSIKKDEDKYAKQKQNKSITSSGYNAYRGNHNGKIQIKAELETINTFSVTYNYIKYKDSEKDKVDIYFDTNWTYENPLETERNKVNIDNILINRLSLGEKVSGTETNKLYEYVKKNNEFIKVGEINKDRTNLGNDLPFKFKYSLENPIGSLTYTIYPVMKYADQGKGTNVYLTPLKREITIDFDKLGSEEFTLEGYQYYVEDDNIKIDLLLKLYPSSDFEITEAKVNFYDLTSSNYEEYKKVKEKFSGVHNKYLVLDEVPDLDNLSGESVNILPLSGWQSITIKFGDNLQKDKCYIVDISFKYRDKMYHLYRVLHTSKIFNTAYNKESKDFNSLNFSDYFKIRGSVEARQKNLLIEHQSPNYNKNTIGDLDGTIDSTINGLYSVEFNITSNFNNCFEISKFTPNIEGVTSSYKDLSVIYNKRDLNLTEKPWFNTDLKASLSGSNLKLDGTLRTPFRVGIVSLNMNSLYMLRPLLLELEYYMGYTAADKNLHYVLSRTMMHGDSSSPGLAQWWNTGTNGDAKCVLKFSDMIDIYSYVHSHLLESDYIPIIYNINYTKDSGDGHYFGVSQNTNLSSENWNQRKTISCILLRQGSSLLQVYIKTTDNGNTQTEIPNLSNYYKLVSALTPIAVNAISDLNIYNKFIVENLIEYNISGIEVKYNDLVIGNGIDEPNLQFTNNSINLESEINWTINNVLELLNLQNPETIVVIEDESGYTPVTLESIDLNKVYKLNGDIYSAQYLICVGKINLVYRIENGVLKINDSISKNNICYITTWYDKGSEHIEAARGGEL